MGTDARTPWPQTITGALFINGVVTAVVSVGTTWLINNAAKLPWPLIVTTFLVVGVVVFLLASLFQKRLREAIWRRPWAWLTGLRITTREGRRALVQEGRDARSAEVAKERELGGQPVWRISVPNQASGFGSFYWLNNHGAGVSDVTLTCDRTLFILHEEVVFPGPLTPHTGKQFSGELTERGRTEGVVFTVAWRDDNGDPQSREVPLTPEGIRDGRDRAFEEARIAGLVQGRKEGRAALQAELEAERQANATRLPPDWAVTEVVTGQLGSTGIELRLTNAEACGPISDVQITHGGGAFTFSASTFVDGEFPGRKAFRGVLSSIGRRRGIDFGVSWLDGNGERQNGVARLVAQPSRTTVW